MVPTPDTRLDRQVAITVPPEQVAADPELKRRFEREAKTLAALSRLYICTRQTFVLRSD